MSHRIGIQTLCTEYTNQNGGLLGERLDPLMLQRHWEEGVTKWICSLLITCALVVNSAAYADSYPSRPITIVVGYAAGSTMDAVARIVGQRLDDALKQPVVIENKPGALGSIASVSVARSAPDGYTLTLGNTGTHAAIKSLLKSLPYDPVTDFAPIGLVGSVVFLLAINSSIPATTLQELATYSKANPGKLSFASANVTGRGLSEMIKRSSGIDAASVPYKSMPQAITDLLAGRTSTLVVDRSLALPHLLSHSIRAIMVPTRERSRLLPDVPSAREAGIPDMDLDSWMALFAPANTPTEIVERLSGELRKIIGNPEVAELLANTGTEAKASTSEHVTELIKADTIQWNTMLKAAGVEPQ